MAHGQEEESDWRFKYRAGQKAAAGYGGGADISGLPVLCPFDSVPVPSLLWPHFPLVGPWEDRSPLTSGLY